MAFLMVRRGNKCIYITGLGGMDINQSVGGDVMSMEIHPVDVCISVRGGKWGRGRKWGGSGTSHGVGSGAGIKN